MRAKLSAICTTPGETRHPSPCDSGAPGTDAIRIDLDHWPAVVGGQRHGKLTKDEIAVKTSFANGEIFAKS
jgi:hypothetical protein